MAQAAHNPRSKHGAHISISDDSHHVTDAISSLYDYEGQVPPPASQSARPLSYMPSAREEIHVGRSALRSPTTSTSPRNPSPFNPTVDTRSAIEGRSSGNGSLRSPTAGLGAKKSPGVLINGEAASPVANSPTALSPQDAAESRYPIDNIDYESSAAAVAQELSNLQALRRLSMNVDATGDPDLPSFAAMPPGKSEDDPSRLFWVPARLHPELAPKEFKSFLDSRVESIKRRSGEFNIPNDDGVGRSPSGGSGGLRRTRSKLSKQIDNTGGRGADGYQDGSEVLDRKRSGSSRLSQSTTVANSLNELETLIEDPSQIITRLSLDSARRSQGEGGDEDTPIIPNVPGTGSLKRSTRTQYRSKRIPGSRRVARTSESADEVPPTPQLVLEQFDNAFSSEIGGGGGGGGGGLQRSMTDPTTKATSNFSRPSRDRGQSPPGSANAQSNVSFEQIISAGQSRSDSLPIRSPVSPPGRDARDIGDGGFSRQEEQAPTQISETMSALPEIQPLSPRSQRFAQEQQAAGYRSRREQDPYPPQSSGEQTLQSIASQPALLPGSNTRTNDLSIIPTITENRRLEPKKSVSKKRSDDGGASAGSGSGKKSVWSSWGSILSSSDGKEKDKESRKKKKEAKDRERLEAAMAAADADDDDVYAREKSRRNKNRYANDTRLDLLQQHMNDGNSGSQTSPRGRESLVLDRESVRLEEARSNERNKKSGREDKPREKDGLLASLFGKKSRSDRDADRYEDSNERPKKSGKSGRSSLRPPSPEMTHYAALVPDVDYNWTRFSILEERAIYRMAHIKLANPRRELRSQVLLSNFMYSYLAKVQQMHPQLQIPQSAAQRKQQERQQAAERERERKESGTPEEYYQYQRYQEQLQAQDAAAAAGQEGAFVEDQGYEYDDQGAYQEGGHDSYAQEGYDYQYSQQQEHSPYQYQRNQFDDPGRRDDDDDMW